MHMDSKKDLNSAEVETMRISRNANGEVQTREEATVYVKELDFCDGLVLMIQFSITLNYFLSLIVTIMFRDSMQDGTIFYNR